MLLSVLLLTATVFACEQCCICIAPLSRWVFELTTDCLALFLALLGLSTVGFAGTAPHVGRSCNNCYAALRCCCTSCGLAACHVQLVLGCVFSVSSISCVICSATMRRMVAFSSRCIELHLGACYSRSSAAITHDLLLLLLSAPACAPAAC